GNRATVVVGPASEVETSPSVYCPIRAQTRPDFSSPGQPSGKRRMVSEGRRHPGSSSSLTIAESVYPREPGARPGSRSDRSSPAKHPLERPTQKPLESNRLSASTQGGRAVPGSRSPTRRQARESYVVTPPEASLTRGLHSDDPSGIQGRLFWASD